MPIERERKFLVEKLPEGVLSRAEESFVIFQEYLYKDSFTSAGGKSSGEGKSGFITP